jgi:hypothetical protein
MQINQNIIKPPPLPPVEYDSTIAKENQWCSATPPSTLSPATTNN